MLNLSEVKKHLYKFTDRNSKYFFKKHGKSILLTVGLLVSVAFILMFTWSLSRLNSKIFAQQEGIVLTSGNILEYCSNTGATSCNLNNKSITAIEPDAFVNHTNLTILNLSNNQISSLNGVNLPDNLSNLFLSNNQISSLSGVEFPNNLSQLELENNEITTLSGIIFPNSLISLMLNNNKINTLYGIEFPNNLSFLHVNNNKITTLAGIEFPNSMNELDISNNLINNLEGVVFPETLYMLGLAGNKITNLSGIVFSGNIYFMYLNNNEIIDVSGVSFLGNINELYLSNNEITDLSGVNFFGNINRLNLNNNKINNLYGIEFPNNLSFLHVNNNKITTLAGITSLPNSLIRLSLNNNEITTLSGVIFPNSLNILHLNNNNIFGLGENFINICSNIGEGGLEFFFNYIDYYKLSSDVIACIDQKHVIYGETDWKNTQTILGCKDTSAINYYPHAEEDDGSCIYNSEPLNVQITGQIALGNYLGSYEYSGYINEGESTYQRYRGDNPISGANGLSYTINENDYGKYISFSVTTINLSGTVGETRQSESLYIHFPPEALNTKILGTNNGLGSSLTGFYNYSGHFLEGDSIYQRYRGDNPIIGSNGLYYTISENDIGKHIRFSVIPININGTMGEIRRSSNTIYVPSPPKALNVQISGQTITGSVLTGFYVYSGDIEEGNSIYQRYKGTGAIVGATGMNYTVSGGDFGSYIYFAVTPVDLNGNTGTTSFSDGFNISDMNVIKKVNVVGFPVQGNLLLGIYDLLDNTWSGKLNYKWYRNDDLIATGISYRLVSGDVGHMVYFEVEPKTNSGVTLNKMKSNGLYVSPSYLVGSGENTCVQQTSGFSSELVSAYLYSYKYGITTICPINSANLYGNLKRNHFAKMISEYAVNVLGKQANTGKNGCDKFADISYETAEMKKFIKTSCELGLMGISSDGVTAMKNFYPNGFVTRAEFGTVLSRLLYGNIYHSDKVYYEKHLQALKNKGIMKNIEKPLAKELRGRVMLMLMRADKSN